MRLIFVATVVKYMDAKGALKKRLQHPKLKYIASLVVKGKASRSFVIYRIKTS
jgi:hypothetical protein